MGYSRSSIVQREDGLWKATIFYTYLYFWENMESDTFKNLNDAQKWLLEKRCYQLVIEEFKQIKEEEAKKVEEEAQKVMKTFSDALKSIPPPPKTPPPPPPVQTMNENCETKPIEKKKNKHHFIED
jgi:hypothetical protein